MSGAARRRARRTLAIYGVARQGAAARVRLRRLAGRDGRLAALTRGADRLDALLDLYQPAGLPGTRPARIALAPVARFMLPLAVLLCSGAGFASAWQAADVPGPVIEALALL